MEFAGLDKAARSKMGVWKMQEWTNQHDFARVDIAGVDNGAPLWQGWTMQEWSEVTKAAYKISSLVNDSLYTYSLTYVHRLRKYHSTTGVINDC